MPNAGSTVLPTRPGTKPIFIDLTAESSDESMAGLENVGDENAAGEDVPERELSEESVAGLDTVGDENAAAEDVLEDEDLEMEESVLVQDEVFLNSPQPDLANAGSQFSVRLPPMTAPISSYITFHDEDSPRPSLEVPDEEDILRELLTEEIKNNACIGDDRFTSLRLDKFVIYRPQSSQGRGSDAEFAFLQDLAVKRFNTCFLFDGYLSVEGNPLCRYVEKVPFEYLSIGGYGDTDVHTVADAVWIQSKVGMKNKVWYQLCSPAKEYQRFYEPFCWLATFAKHFLDFMDTVSAVSLQMFSNQFWNWARALHGDSPAFQTWAGMYSDTDYRRVVTAHFAFLMDQARQMDEGYLGHPLWTEINPQSLTAIPAQQKLTDYTIVTPSIQKCFSKMAWSPFMKPLDPNPLTAQQAHFSYRQPRITTAIYQTISIGDVVKIQRDQSGRWQTSNTIWLAYIQEVVTYRGKNAFRVLWLYHPADTICSNMHYPCDKELFLSNHCECQQAPIAEDAIEGKTSVAFFGTPSLIDRTSNIDYFVRQSYSNEAFESLQDHHFQCDCNRTKAFDYQVGDTVLIPSAIDPKMVDVGELLSRPFRGDETVSVRQLLQRRRDLEDNTAKPNELVHTQRRVILPASDIIRRCHVRIFPESAEQEDHYLPPFARSANGGLFRLDDHITPPFTRGGTGDAFFITHRENGVGGELQPLRYPRGSFLKQSVVPPEPRLPRLKTLDLFCGGGNFGRGVEEGGVAQVKWAIDYDEVAMHSYRANLHHPEDVHLYLGSVNDYLSQAVNEDSNPLIAKRGQVDLILAGSPCQGFSLANKLRSNDRGLQNQSMVASVASFVDFYRPKYALLENVKNMAATMKEHEGQNVFSQMICALVSMGYQVHQFCVDAWSVGSPQARTRLFIAATAPGLVPLQSPPITHSHPARVGASSLGKTANGLPFGSRDLEAVATFPYVSIGEAIKDLDYTFDGKDISIKFPDHRITTNENTNARLRMSYIPRNVPKASLGMAVRAGLVPGPLMESLTPKLRQKLEVKNCGSYQRNHADDILSTVTTTCTPMCQYTGRVLHWDCDRPMTVLEVRRAQGFLDYEIIVGSPAQQWKVVGNSVARPVALALGMSLREAWIKHNFPDGVHGRNPSPVGGMPLLIDMPCPEDFDWEVTEDRTRNDGSP